MAIGKLYLSTHPDYAYNITEQISKVMNFTFRIFLGPLSKFLWK